MKAHTKIGKSYERLSRKNRDVCKLRIVLFLSPVIISSLSLSLFLSSLLFSSLPISSVLYPSSKHNLIWILFALVTLILPIIIIIFLSYLSSSSARRRSQTPIPQGFITIHPLTGLWSTMSEAEITSLYLFDNENNDNWYDQWSVIWNMRKSDHFSRSSMV